MSCIPRLSQTLRARGYRMTPQRQAILQALHEGGHLSPGQVFEHVRPTGMTAATVYRTLEFLARNAIIFPNSNRSGHLTYELAASEHQHLACRRCGAQVEIQAGTLKGFLSQLEQQSGYRLDASHLTFIGLCPGCQERME